MPRVLQFECLALRRVRWKDDVFILSLLSRTRGLLSASWKLPSSARRPGRELCPELFAPMRATLSAGESGVHRLRSFKSLPGPWPRTGDYQRQSLLARAIVLSAAESPHEERYWHLWMREAAGDARPLLELLADYHYAFGTWPSAQECEECGTVLADAFLDRDSAILCPDCAGPDAERIAPRSLGWLRRRYRSADVERLPAGPLQGRTAALLARRLPENLRRDRVFRRLLGGLEPSLAGERMPAT